MSKDNVWLGMFNDGLQSVKLLEKIMLFKRLKNEIHWFQTWVFIASSIVDTRHIEICQLHFERVDCNIILAQFTVPAFAFIQI